METALTQDRSATPSRSTGASAPQIEHVVNGKKFAGNGTRTLNVFNPATGEVVGWVKAATAADVDAPVLREGVALRSWVNAVSIKNSWGLIF
jgi:delta 1-pyrroline-5-carboxylate dehydrogenase